MADPYNYSDTPSMKAARAAIAAEAEPLPEEMEDLTFEQAMTVPPAKVESPATVTEPHYEGEFGDRVPAGMEDLTQHTRVDPPMADIVQSPRAAAGGPGETAAEIQQTAESAPDAAAEAEMAAEAALGEDIDLSYATNLLRMAEGGIIDPLPAEVTQLLRRFVTLSNQVKEYEQASALAAKEMG